jgi:hypothetical protein
MTFEEFTRTTDAQVPPPSLAPALVALWYDAKGQWHDAHRIAQDIDDATGAWVHAYLHRKEGDLGNAEYWYRRAGRPVANDPLEIEWESIARAVVSNASAG